MRDRGLARALVLERAPGHRMILECPADLIGIFIGVDSDQNEWFVLQALHERPLFWDQFHARETRGHPEGEEHDLAAVPRESHWPAVEVLPIDFAGGLASA